MKHNTRRTAAVVGMLAASATGLTVAVPAAQAAEPAPSRITMYSTNYHPASGQQFRVYGKLTSLGKPVADARVAIKTYRNDQWVQLTGAVVYTNDEGQYRCRIILQMKGKRLLRAVGDPKGTSIATARKTITVYVH